MALEESGNGLFMPVAPAYSAGGNGNGNGFGGDWAWIILLLLLGWGNNGFGGGNGGGYGGNVLYPWMNQSDQINNGFRDQMLNTSISNIQNSITSGFGDVQTALCGGFAGVNAAITGAQMADLERSFAAQTANMQGFNSLQGALSSCCCENRAATADLKYTVATENCQDRYAAAQNTRDIIDAQTRSTQAILDKLCALELDGLKQDNANLRQQLNMATLRESQTAQNAFIQQGFSNEVDALYNRLSSCPVPSTPVYGRTPIFTCGAQNQGCGCSGNGFYN